MPSLLSLLLTTFVTTGTFGGYEATSARTVRSYPVCSPFGVDWRGDVVTGIECEDRMRAVPIEGRPVSEDLHIVAESARRFDGSDHLSMPFSIVNASNEARWIGTEVWIELDALNPVGTWTNVDREPEGRRIDYVGEVIGVRLRPHHAWHFRLRVFYGPFPTKLRLRVICPRQFYRFSDESYETMVDTLYSNEFFGSVNPEWFDRMDL